VRCALLVALAAVALQGAMAGALEAQEFCQRNGTGNCTISDNTLFTINITITRAVRLSMTPATVLLDTPTGAEFEAGFGQTTGPVLTMKANTAWSISIRSTQALWTATPAAARQDKPVSDLRWGTAVAGPFTSFTTANVTLRSGATATAGTVIPLFLRVQYAWLLDVPGSYTLPLQLTVTAP